MPKNIAIFASGSGSNAENIIRYFQNKGVFNFPVIISNRSDAYIHQRAESLNIKSITCSRKDFETGDSVLELLRGYQVDIIVLAGFLLKVPELLVDAFPNRIINIHHSFLPAFAGAKPYHAAHARGVKLIGATSHYVTADLDAGPIIAQDVIPVNHKDSVSDLVRKGQDIEKLVLAQAVWHHLQNRVLVYNNKTVVFQ